jgi:3-hydroxybutyryl-CoA dehydrogenase
MPAITKTICVCGAGTMGTGIAQTAAQHGFKVKVYDLNKEMLVRSKTVIEYNLQSLLEKQKITITQQQSISGNIQWFNDQEQCKAEIIIEAIVEDLQAKNKLFQQMAVVSGSNAVYASNTSSLPITAIAAAHPFPSRVAGLHFFNPPTLMKLVEIVECNETDSDTTNILVQFVKDLQKTGVICKDAPGFIVNRVARPYYIEALRLAEEGVPFSVIDALLMAAGFKMGPFRLMDLIGNDVNYAVSCGVYEQLGEPERLKPSYIQQQKVDQGKLGRKSGAGYYTYNT